MAKDVKIEIIYFKSNTDISLEFGLHGDYPVRLLSSSCNDFVSFFHTLKRAISRSEIIIITGGYKGTDYLPKFLARALSTECNTPDLNELNIISRENYEIPVNAIPLAGSSKRFGGFLIESGPQTIISLTDDKKARLDVVKSVVVSYISEHYAVFNKAKSSFIDKIDNKEVDANYNEVNLADNIPDINTTIEFEEILSNSVEEELEPIIIDVASDIEKTKIEQITEKYNASGKKIFDLNPDDFVFDTPEPAKLKKRYRFNWLRILSIILSTLITVFSVAGILVFSQKEKHKNPYKVLADQFYSYGTNHVDAFQKLQQYNKSINSWIKIENTIIDYPVITTEKNTNFDYYKNHLPDGSVDNIGSVFTTSIINSNSTENCFIYGSAQNGGAFSPIRDLFNTDFDAANVTLTLTSQSSKSTWTPVSLFKESTVTDFDYLTESFATEQKRKEYIIKLLEVSEKKLNVDVYYGCPTIMLLIGLTDYETYVVAVVPTIYTRDVSVSVNADKQPIVSTEQDTESNIPNKIIIGVNDEDVEFVGKENMDEEYEQEPNEGGVIEIPPVIVPDTSSEISSSSSKQSSTIISSSFISQSTVESLISSFLSSEISNSTETSTSQPQPPKPTVDPFLTWDINITVKNGDNWVSGTAVEIVAKVIEAEISSSSPIEALKAQAICTYNWLINNGVLEGRTPSVPMKVARDRAIEAVNAVKGTILTYDNKIAQTYCHDHSAGYTASYHHIWQWNNWQNTTSYPYLQGVESKQDENVKGFKTTTTYDSDTVKQLIKDKLGIDVSGMDKKDWIVPRLYDDNNLYCIRVVIGGKEFAGQDLRMKLFGTYSSGGNPNGLRSSAYTVSYNANTDKFTIICKGWGHGVGLSQQGAIAYANDGWSFEQILTHYFKGTTVKKYQ